ncbi:MAG: DUF502 domain-containing protein [Planctomycetales bacterium]|nr:DUF502 domain-containing protein [Planctomycetales bacterium]
MSDSPSQSVGSPPKPRPFRRAVLRGLGVVMPPLLTIVLLIWVLNAVQSYVLTPIEEGVSWGITWALHENPRGKEIQRERVELEKGITTGVYRDEVYVLIPNGDWVKHSVFSVVQENPGEGNLRTSRDYVHRYVEIKFLRRSLVLPVFFCLFILALYFLGKFMAAGVGRMVWSTLESIINQLPIVRNIYSSVKQVTDFVFSENEVGFTRVVAVQYPRRGIWSLAFVTGESMLDVRSAANEPVLSLLIPTSPMPATGFTVTVLKSETLDLDITMDQAIQFIVSCGVVVPSNQLYQETNFAAKIAAAIEKASAHADKSAGRLVDQRGENRENRENRDTQED